MQFVLISEKHKMTMLGKRLGKTFNNKTKGNSEKTEMVQLDLLTENRAADIQQKPIKGFHTAEEMQDSILDLCRSLSRKTSEGEFDCKIWVEKLETYLSNSADRLMYSSISNHIFNKTEQELGTFGTNLDFVLHYVERKVEDNPASEYWKKSFKNVLKFYDHSNLAIQQQKLVSKKRMDLEHEVESILAPKISEITKRNDPTAGGIDRHFHGVVVYCLWRNIFFRQHFWRSARNIKRAAIGASCSYSCGCMGVLHDESAIWIHVFCDTHYDFEETRCRKSS